MFFQRNICTRRSPRPGNSLATSLIEILFAITIVSALATPLVMYVLSTKRGIIIPQEQLLATNLASAVTSILRDLRYEEIPVSKSDEDVPQPRWNEETFRLAPALSTTEWKGEFFDFSKVPDCPEKYQRWLSIEEVPVSDEAGCTAKVKIVVVRVTWKKAQRGDGEVRLTTCFLPRK